MASQPSPLDEQNAPDESIIPESTVDLGNQDPESELQPQPIEQPTLDQRKEAVLSNFEDINKALGNKKSINNQENGNSTSGGDPTVAQTQKPSADLPASGQAPSSPHKTEAKQPKSVNPNEKAQASKSAQMINAGKEKINKLKEINTRAGEIKQGLNAAGELKENAKDYAKQYAKDAAKAATKKAAKAALKAASRAIGVALRQAAAVLAANPITWIVIGVIVLVVVIIGVIIIIYSFSRPIGRGPMVAPTTAEQVVATSELQALSGNKIANSVLVSRTINATKTRLAKIKSIIPQAYPGDNTTVAAASADLDKITPKLDAILSVSAVEERKKLIAQVTQELAAFNKKYPKLIGFGAVHGSSLPVPGVIEGTSGDCGQASTIMVILYYNPAYTDSKYYDPITRATKDNLACVSPDYINQKTSKDFIRTKASQTNFEKVKKSLSNGDPVIIYTKEGGIFSNSKHIFVITGYDPADNTYFVNNPSVGKVEVATKNPNGVRMTESHLKKHLGDPIPYDHSFMIRKVHTDG